jgi:oligoendopeptidase F
MQKSLILMFFACAALCAASVGQAAAKPDTRNREEIPDKYKWDLSHIYGSWEAWEADLAKLQDLMDKYQEFRGTLAEGP